MLNDLWAISVESERLVGVLFVYTIPTTRVYCVFIHCPCVRGLVFGRRSRFSKRVLLLRTQSLRDCACLLIVRRESIPEE